MTVLVSDMSILVDLERAGFLQTVFQLPFSFAVPDVLYHREIEISWGSTLLSLGLRVEEVSAEGVVKALHYRALRRALSVPDSFALALAEEQNWTLMTGDAALRELAETRSIACHGVLWLFDKMEQHAVVTLSEMHQGLQVLADHPRCRLPQNEVSVRLQRYITARGASGD